MCVILAYMKKLTTAIIVVAILIVLVITGRIFYNQNQHMMTATTPEDAVKNFLEMMIPHHSEAVEFSKVIMMDREITNPEVRIFAARIADAQEFEIAQMEGWYQEWFKTEYVFDPSIYKPMMSDSKETTGDVRARVYLKDMIAHHQHAIDSAQDTREQIDSLMKNFSKSDGTITITNSHPGIDTTVMYAKHVEEAQQKEIEEMKALLNVL